MIIQKVLPRHENTIKHMKLIQVFIYWLLIKILSLIMSTIIQEEQVQISQ